MKKLTLEGYEALDEDRQLFHRWLEVNGICDDWITEIRFGDGWAYATCYAVDDQGRPQFVDGAYVLCEKTFKLKVDVPFFLRPYLV